jgi:valyl-tRNA synthetase
MHSEGFSATTAEPVFDPALLRADDKHILARLQEAIAACTANLESCRFNDAAHDLYEFVWHQFCDWYVEFAKEDLYGQDTARREQVLRLMHYVFGASLRLLHPMMPFITEELWHAMGYGAAEDSIMLAPWPKAVGDEVLRRWGVSPDWVAYVEDKHDLIRAGRTLRADYGIAPSVKVKYLVKPDRAADAARLEADANSLKAMLRAETIEVDPSLEPAKAMPSGISRIGAVYMPLEGLIDVDAEIRRLTVQLEKDAGELARTRSKLANIDFVSKAPPAVVERQNARERELVESSRKLDQMVQTLSAIRAV